VLLGVLLGVLLAELLALLDDTTVLADVELTTKKEDEEDGVLLPVLDATIEVADVELTTEVGAVLLALVGLELTTDEEVGALFAELELMIAGAVLVFAGAWLVTATLGVWVEEATLSVAGTGTTVPVLVLAATAGCADCRLQKLRKGANSGLA